MKKYIRIMRLDHWIKQLFIIPGSVCAIALTKEGGALNSLIIKMLLGLLATSLIASANYVINEWLDAEFDKYHPTKKYRTVVTEDVKGSVVYLLWGMLTYEQQNTIDTLAPTHIQVPTGSRIRVDYRQGAEAPVLSVRLQECFGLTSTPCVDGGKRPVLMELLSPGFKPVQLTQDLANFWQSTYFEVRKELRRRYPKHHWPDNPLEAQAVRGVKRR